MSIGRMKHALQGTLAVSSVGLLFSGYLTYRELFASALACPSPGAPGTILGYPACVYGFFMYCVVAIISVVGLTGANDALPNVSEHDGIREHVEREATQRAI